MTTFPESFRADLIDLRRQIDIALTLLDEPCNWRPCEPGSPADGFCLGNWRIVPRFQENAPSEPPEASRMAFMQWWESDYWVSSCREIAWEAWKASRAQLNSTCHQ